jgi:hypothetical protein
MRREIRLLRASVPFLAFSAVFAEGVPPTWRVLGVVGIVLLTRLIWPAPVPVTRDAKAEQPRAPP